MSPLWWVLPPVAASLVTAIAMKAAVRLAGTIRRHDYRMFEDQSSEEIARRFSVPPTNGSPAENVRRSLATLLDRHHQAANSGQTSYHNAVVRSAGCLAVAFIALALGSLHVSEAAHHAPLGWDDIETILSWTEVIALSSVLLLFLYGRRRNPQWIAARAGTELLRQHQFIAIVFPSAAAAMPGDSPEAQFEHLARQIVAGVEAGPIAGIVKRIELYWSDRRASIERSYLTEHDATPDALLMYLHRRARRQLGWFIDSKARLEHIAERRAVVLLCLYLATLMLALLKLFSLIHCGNAPAYLLPLLLIVAGMSATMTTYYINQNARSLIHRYNTQQRFVERWLAEFSGYWKPGTAIVDPSMKSNIRTRILHFEDLMIEELIDWTHITSHDAIELGP